MKINWILVVCCCLHWGIAEAYEIISPKEGEVVATQTEKQKAFLGLPRDVRIKEFANADARNKLVRAGWQELCSLKWQGGTAPYEVTLERVKDGRIWWSGVVTNAVKELYNLEVACEYEWMIKDADDKVLRGKFKTEGLAPRFLSFLGPYNCRDLGGWIGDDGRRVRQGLAFRTAGLNYNSTPGFTSPKEGKILDKNGVVEALCEPIKKQLAFWEQCSEADVSWVSVDVPRVWQVKSVMRPKPIQDLEWLVSSNELDGAKTEVVDDEYCVDLHGIGDGWSLLETTIKSPADGYTLLGCGGDWFWAMAVNGIPVRDRLLSGNGRDRCGIDNHIVCIPLRKGDNRLRVLLGAGTSGFRWFCGPTRKLPFNIVQPNEKKHLDSLVSKLWERPSEVKVGASRLSESECRRWLEQFGVKTELDLRSEGETRGMTGSPLGPSVEWIRVTCPAYQNIMNTKGRDGVRDVLRVIFDSSKYPLIFHCIGGRDRTGTIAFLLNGLLGVDEEDLFRDWESTGFCLSNIGFQHKGSFIPLVKSFDNYPGKTLNERIEAYVKSLGFSDEEIERYREFMLEKPVTYHDK